jgi:hypothetical protein
MPFLVNNLRHYSKIVRAFLYLYGWMTIIQDLDLAGCLRILTGLSFDLFVGLSCRSGEGITKCTNSRILEYFFGVLVFWLKEDVSK